MAQELTGLEYLKKKEIKGMKCDMNKSFAFISYSHDDYDSQIVMNVFKQLMSRGCNLWIDTANMPANEDNWKKSAISALRNRNCKFAFFFRSESSMVKETIADELKNIKILNHIKSTVAVDIWHEEDMNADTYYKKILNGDPKDDESKDDESKDISSCMDICECVSTKCKAIRLAGDAGNDIARLVEEMEEVFKEKLNDDVDGDGDGNGDGSVDSDNDVDVDEEDKKETVHIISDGSIFHIKGRDGVYDAFYCKENDRYTVLRGSKVRYNENYTPKRIWDQNKNNITAEGYLLCDIGDLVISAAAKLIEGTATSGKELDDPEKIMGVNESYSIQFDISKIPTETEEVTISRFSDGYHYHIFGAEYHAGRREQANLMYDTFDALTDKHPEKVMKIAEKCTSVSKKDDVSESGTRNARPPYFRMCKEFTVSGVEYVVGSSYGFESKIAEIYRMIDACGEDRSIFELEGFEQKKRKDTKEITGTQDEETKNAGFEYALWGVLHTANKMSDMMHDVFDLIAEKYPEKISDIVVSDSISSVARKEEVDGRKLPPNKMNYFRAAREHHVGDTTYYVGTSYNRSQGIGQLERMLKICEGNAESFRIISSPERTSCSGVKTGKKGLDELL